MKRNIVPAVLLLLWGCASTREIPARLYNLDTAEVIQARFIFSGKTSGNIEFTTATGENFQGEYPLCQVELPLGGQYMTVFIVKQLNQ